MSVEDPPGERFDELPPQHGTEARHRHRVDVVGTQGVYYPGCVQATVEPRPEALPEHQLSWHTGPCGDSQGPALAVRDDDCHWQGRPQDGLQDGAAPRRKNGQAYVTKGPLSHATTLIRAPAAPVGPPSTSTCSQSHLLVSCAHGDRGCAGSQGFGPR